MSAAGYREGGRAVSAALDALAAARRTGTARLVGEGGGTVGALYFRNGRVVGSELGGRPTGAARLVASGRLTEPDWDEFAEACEGVRTQPEPTLPPAAGLDRAEWAAISLDAVLDAAAELLPTAPGHDLPNSRGELVVQPDTVPGWTASGCSVELRDLRHELRRRQCVLDRLRPVVTPDSVLHRAVAPWAGPVQISARQWRVLRAVDGRAAPRDIAGRIGAGVFATTVLVRGLIDLGMLSTDAGWRPGEAFPATLFSDAVVGNRW